MDKKGAIEFSMTTIMVIIIGVAVLALGLTWIRGTFTQVGDITDDAFSQARNSLSGELGPSNRVVVSPSSLNLAANQQRTVSVGCYNDASGSARTASLNSLSGTNIDVDQSANPSVPSGRSAFWGVVVKAKSGVTSATTPEVLTLNIDCNGQVETRALSITYK